MTGPTLAERLAEFVTGPAGRDLPRDVQARGGMYLLHLAAVALAGSRADSSQPVLRVVRAAGGRPEATVFGVGRIASAMDAALANGTAAHALELDDDHRTGTVHPGAVVVPAALAACEAAGAAGRTLLRAIVLGYEVMCRVGEAFMGRQFYRGFHPTGTCGVFGAAVAAGVAFGLDREQMVRALGIAGTQASGLAEWRADGSWIKRLHPGRAAHGGVLAARLAQAGFSGPATILEGPSGFLQAFAFEGAVDADAITRGLGKEFRAMGTAFKPYPCCRFSHGALDLALALRRDGITAGDVDSIRLRIYKTDILNYLRRPPTTVDAQFCLPYLVAAALVRGRLGLRELTEAAIRDPEILALADRISVEEDPAFTGQYPDRYPTELTVVLRGGRELVRFNDCPSGDPEAPEYAADPGRLHEEVRGHVRALLEETGFGDRAEPLIATAAALPELPSVRPLAELLS
jgi:2-methylcitrate dehydratase PrpD